MVSFIYEFIRIIMDIGVYDYKSDAQVRELCGFTRQQSRTTLEKMQTEDVIVLQGKGRYAKYVAGERFL